MSGLAQVASQLSGHEYQTLHMFAAGKTPEQIADGLSFVNIEMANSIIDRFAGGDRRRAKALVDVADAVMSPPAQPAPRQMPAPAKPQLDRLAALLAGAQNSHNARTRTLGVKLKDLVDDLSKILPAEQKEAAARREQEKASAALEAEIAAARKALAAAQAKLEKLTGAVKVSPKLVRAWAAQNGIECGPIARIPKHVVDQYLAAQDVVAQDVA